jgi:hypothetical protein
MSLSRSELLQQLENIRQEKSTGTMLVTTQNQRCASITLSNGEIVAATFGTSFGLEALKALTTSEFLSSTMKKNYNLRFPMAEIEDPQAAHRILETGDFKFSPPQPKAATEPVPAPVNSSPPSKQAAEYKPAATENPARPLINKAILATIEALTNDILSKPRGSEVFREALSQIDDDLEEKYALQLLLVLIIEQIEDAATADRFAQQITKTLNIK